MLPLRSCGRPPTYWMSFHNPKERTSLLETQPFSRESFMIAGAIHVWKDKDFLAAKCIYHLLAEISIGRGPTFRQTSVYPRLKSKHCYFIICFQETKSRVIYNSNHLIIQSNNVTPRVLLHTKNQIFIKSSKLPSLRSTPPKKKSRKKKRHHPKLQVQLTTETTGGFLVKVWTQPPWFDPEPR